MPASEREPRQRGHRDEQRDPGECDECERRKEPRDVELDAGEQDLVGEPRALAAGAATNSATTAPISARPLAMRRPAKKYGSALGTRSRHSVCQREARARRKRSASPGSTLRRPSVVFEITGKIATTVAQMTSASQVSRTQMMTRGAIDTIGVTCSRIA